MAIKIKKFNVVDRIQVIRHTASTLMNDCDSDERCENDVTLFICKDEEEAKTKLQKYMEEHDWTGYEDDTTWSGNHPILDGGAEPFEFRHVRLIEVESVDAERDKLDQFRLNEEYIGKSFFVFGRTTLKGVVLFDGLHKKVSDQEVEVEFDVSTTFTVNDRDTAHYGPDHVALFLRRTIYVPSVKQYVKEIFLPRDGNQIRELYANKSIQITV